MLGASFVARSFSGDKEQLVPLLKAALSHKGFSFLDIISPCVTFNNHNTSTKSYDYIREHNDALSRPDFVPSGKEILTEYPRGSSIEVPLHDGSLLSLEKLSESYDPTDKIKAIQNIQESQRDGKVLTGLLYADPEAKDLREILNVSDKPLNKMGQKVWEDAGQSSDPGGYYYVGLLFDAAGDTAGDLSFIIEYVID